MANSHKATILVYGKPHAQRSVGEMRKRTDVLNEHNTPEKATTKTELASYTWSHGLMPHSSLCLSYQVQARSEQLDYFNLKSNKRHTEQ
jgi:hypothetical protein